jgi:hypothetical protein
MGKGQEERSSARWFYLPYALRLEVNYLRSPFPASQDCTVASVVEKIEARNAAKAKVSTRRVIRERAYCTLEEEEWLKAATDVVSRGRE